ncbi:hypothetical protein SY89_00523 [Halolamina pelagica]|uniref:Uncharacterized protein n=1 Tax=Halolamina pelagica TaxID=699431 RepID=A0A0P7HZK6_9EURY|nr:hypothetical protein [Halolamina pelagica]KPN29805.1 hypothetical protein SY89_00523 [Halolamina pelagica]
MDRRRVALLLAVVGLLCLPAPYYLGWAAEATSPPERTSQIYAAEPINLDDASDRKRLVDAHGHEVTIADYRITARYGDDYRAPNATLAALVTAMREGSASVDDPDARADLREIGAANEFVRDTNDNTEPDGYYRLSVEQNGSVVRAEQVSLRPVADAIADRAPRYATLSAGEQRTVDRIVDNSTGEGGGTGHTSTSPTSTSCRRRSTRATRCTVSGSTATSTTSDQHSAASSSGSVSRRSASCCCWPVAGSTATTACATRQRRRGCPSSPDPSASRGRFGGAGEFALLLTSSGTIDRRRRRGRGR